MVNKIFEITDSEFTTLIKTSTCIKEVLFKLGYSASGNSWGYNKVKERMQILNLSTNDFKGKSGLKASKSLEIPNEQLFTKNNHPRNIVRKRILRDSLLEYKCAICGISKWNNKTLSLELDHINGINNDHRLENLRFLCPNCHSQTSTYGAKNKDVYVVDFEITDEMKELVKNTYNELHNREKIAKKLGFKEKVVKEILNELGLSKPNLKFVIRYDKDMNEITRYGSIAEACQAIIDNGECKTKLIKTCRATFLRNCDKFWLNSYWKILDA